MSGAGGSVEDLAGSKKTSSPWTSWLAKSRSTIATAALVVGCVLWSACAGSQGGGTADLVVRGGKIVTMNEAQPEVEAIAARDGRIVFAGSASEAAAFVGADTRVIELGDALAVPGLIEGHGHFYGIGQTKLQLDLTGAASFADIVDIVAEAASSFGPDAWIVGRGWHQSKWTSVPEGAVDGVPLHDELSAVSPDNPVYLTHASGHAAFVNAKALELAGIDSSTPDPDGGTIVRDANGRATGLLRETAQGLVGRLRSGELEWNEARRVLALAADEVLANGITSFQDAGSSIELVDLLRSMADEDALKVRLWVMVRDSVDAMRENLARVRTIGGGDDYLTVRAIKKSIDGALGSHGAWLLEPYEDLPGSAGLNTVPLDEMEDSAALALEHDYQFCVHAIGDRANRETLDIFERAFEQSPRTGRDLRWRVEHAQHLSPRDIPRFASLGVIASMQGVHCTSDGSWVPDRLGERRAREGAYVWRKLLDSGVVIANGTDAPVEDVSPIASFTSTVTRRLGNGELFYPDQRLTREEALRSYTLDAAFAAFEEDIKGSLEVGKLADITILDRDIMTVDEDQLAETRVLHTIVGGEVRYSAD